MYGHENTESTDGKHTLENYRNIKAHIEYHNDRITPWSHFFAMSFGSASLDQNLSAQYATLSLRYAKVPSHLEYEEKVISPAEGCIEIAYRL